MQPISVPEMALRLALAFGAGFLVGWERESRGRPAGLRTNILACVASALAAMVSALNLADIPASLANAIRADPNRLAAGVLTGIGFLGAGTILRHEDMVRGVTTAASLWFVTILGLALGSGFFVLAGLALAVAMLTIFVLPRLENHIRSTTYATLSIRTGLSTPTEAELRNRLQARGVAIIKLKLHYDLEQKVKTLTCNLRLRDAHPFELASQLVTSLTQCPGVLAVEWA